MNRNRLEESAEAVEWSKCLDRMLHRNGSPLVARSGFVHQQSCCFSSSDVIAVEKMFK